jgi:hypothetical protein
MQIVAAHFPPKEVGSPKSPVADRIVFAEF